MNLKICLPQINLWNIQCLLCDSLNLGAQIFSILFFTSLGSKLTSPLRHFPDTLPWHAQPYCITRIATGQVIGTRTILGLNWHMRCWAVAVISSSSLVLVIIGHIRVISCSYIIASILDDAQRSCQMCCGSPNTNAQAFSISRPRHCKSTR